MKENKKNEILCIDSDYDEETKYSKDIRNQYLYKILEEKEFILNKIDSSNLNDTEKIRNRQISYITGSGHGNESNFFIQKDKTILSTDKNLIDIKDKVIHLFACLTAINLGENLVKNGAKAFIGYSREIPVVGEEAGTPIFCDYQIDIALSEGKNVEQAYQTAYDTFTQHIKIHKDKKNMSFAAALTRLRNNLCSPVTNPKYGDKNARIG
ncbi:MAG: hypothetical protein A2Y34_01645 [Spirochaetes bacterium GWC1_27_15]|nr:MAG: hypothetical protein A2Z98_17425 [Spirochaetes bacterium GWB1_27_13]OHD26637.1 MAG: hypothetical protein A2Y34_01645 [Spirochaetes bacterium GWC1_27_15]